MLLGFGLTPKPCRVEGQRFCPWRVELHLTEQLREVLHHGCFCPQFRDYRKYAWLYASPPLVWLQLTPILMLDAWALGIG
eukprot:3232959-Amphidinium_carterae.1